jgi:hypothetical protein
VVDITPQAEKWKAEDQASFKRSACLGLCNLTFSRYAATYGVVGDMATNDEIRAVEASAEGLPPPASATAEEEEKEAVALDLNVFPLSVSISLLKAEPSEISVPKEMSAHILEKQTMQFVVPGKIIHLSITNGCWHLPLSRSLLATHDDRVLSRSPLRPPPDLLAIHHPSHPRHRGPQDGEPHQGTPDLEE